MAVWCSTARPSRSGTTTTVQSSDLPTAPAVPDCCPRRCTVPFAAGSCNGADAWLHRALPLHTASSHAPFGKHRSTSLPLAPHMFAAAKTTQTASANGGDGGTGIKGRKMLVHYCALCIVHAAFDVQSSFTSRACGSVHAWDVPCTRHRPCPVAASRQLQRARDVCRRRKQCSSDWRALRHRRTAMAPSSSTVSVLALSRQLRMPPPALPRYASVRPSHAMPA